MPSLKARKSSAKRDDVRKYQALHNSIQEAFLATFYRFRFRRSFKNSGSVQTGHAMALCANLIPLQDRAAVLNKIVDELKAKNYQQDLLAMSANFSSFENLAEAGRSDVLHKVYSRTQPQALTEASSRKE